MTRTETRILSGAVGLLLVVIGIILENVFPDNEREVQITVWTSLVVAMAVLVNYKHRREQWFWKGFVLGSLLHIAILYKVRQSLPFHDLGVAILLAFPEAILWQLIFRSLSVKNLGGW